MTDEVQAWQVHPVVAPDGSTAVAETPFSSLVFKGVSGPLPDSFTVNITVMGDQTTTSVTFPSSAWDGYAFTMSIIPRDEG